MFSSGTCSVSGIQSQIKYQQERVETRLISFALASVTVLQVPPVGFAFDLNVQLILDRPLRVDCLLFVLPIYHGLN